MPSQVRLSKILWRNAWPTPTGRNMSSQTKVDFEDDKIRPSAEAKRRDSGEARRAFAELLLAPGVRTSRY
jgi:hypothetical protein